MRGTRILHIAPAYQINGGGIFEVVENLSSAQCKEKNTLVDIMCLETFIKKDGLNKVIYNVFPSSIMQIKLIALTLKFLFMKMRLYDVVHIHGAWSYQLAFIVPFIFFYKNKIVYQPHGLLCRVPMKKSWLIKRIAWFTYQGLFLTFCKNIICCSNKERDELLSLCKSPHKIKVIPNGLDGAFFTNKSSADPRKDRFLFFSQIIPIKNLESLFHAVAMLKRNDTVDIYIDIYGYGPETYIAELRNLVDKLSINDNIIFKGRIARDNRVDIYDRYKYFVLPSLSENFGIAVLEALSRGCKVIVSRQTPWVDYDHGNITLIDPEKKSIYDALKALITDNNGPVSLNAKNNFNIAEFSWDELSKDFVRLYFDK